MQLSHLTKMRAVQSHDVHEELRLFEARLLIGERPCTGWNRYPYSVLELDLHKWFIQIESCIKAWILHRVFYSIKI